MRIVDFHTHFFSRTYFETLAAQSPLPGDAQSKLADVARRAKLEIPDASVEAHTRRWLAEADRHGVEHVCAFASVPEETPVVVEAARLSNGRISAFALVNPRVEGAAARVDALLGARAIRGVLLFPALHHWRADGAEARALFEVLDRHAAIAYVHCGLLVVKLRELLGFPRVQDLSYAHPLALVAAANQFRSVRFVVPHFGAGFFAETLLLGAQCDNVHVDTSSSNGWRSYVWPKPTLAQVFERALEAFGPERILFGTDSNTFPAGWREDRCDEQRAALTAGGADARVLELVLGGNARRLLGLPR